MKILFMTLVSSTAIASEYHFDCNVTNEPQTIVASGYIDSEGETQFTAKGKTMIIDTDRVEHVFEDLTFNYLWGYMMMTNFSQGRLQIMNFYDQDLPIKTARLSGLREEDLECKVTKDTFISVGTASIGPWSDTGQDLKPQALASADYKANYRCSPKAAMRVSEVSYNPSLHPTRFHRSVAAVADYQCQ